MLKLENIKIKYCLIALFGFISIVLPINISAQDFSNIKNEKPLKVSGNISLGSFLYNANGIDARQQPFGYSLGANLNFNIYGIAIPFYASFNEQGGAFQHPFNRYGISPRYKWITAHIGWRNLNLSQFSLSNSTFLGGALELKPGKFRFAAMYGKLKQPAELQNINFQSPQFKRKAMALKLGYGTERNYLDFIVFKAKDDTLSLPNETNSTKKNIPAYENLVVGVKNKLSFFENKLSFNFDASFSAFSHDIRYHDIDILDDSKYSWVNSIFRINSSTVFNYAGETDITYHHKYFSLGAKYRRVMPDYSSLGSEYILNDLEAITVNPSVNLLKGKAVISASVGTQRNNLDGKRISTNDRIISSVNLNINPSPYWGVMFGYSNYTFQQQILIDSLYNDSMVVNQLNQNYNVIPRVTIIKDKFVHNLVLTANYQILNDKNDVTSDVGGNTMLLSNLVYSMMIKKMALKLRLGASYFKFNSGLININRYGINFGASKKFLKNKLRANFVASFNKQEETYKSSAFMTLNAGINYQIFKKTSAGLHLYYNNINSTSRKYNEQRFQFSLRQGF